MKMGWCLGCENLSKRKKYSFMPLLIIIMECKIESDRLVGPVTGLGSSPV